MINIERLILCSVLENYHIGADPKILCVELDSKYFESKHHKILVNAINRLKELDEPIDSDTVREKFKSVGKWDNVMIDNIMLEDALLSIMVTTPAGSYEMFMKYYNFLKKSYYNKEKIEALRYI